MVLRTLVAGKAFHVGEARALAGLPVAHGRPFQRRVAPEEIADAGGALLGKSIAEESLLANVAAESFRVEKALLALARPGIAVARPG